MAPGIERFWRRLHDLGNDLFSEELGAVGPWLVEEAEDEVFNAQLDVGLNLSHHLVRRARKVGGASPRRNPLHLRLRLGDGDEGLHRPPYLFKILVDRGAVLAQHRQLVAEDIGGRGVGVQKNGSGFLTVDLGNPTPEGYMTLSASTGMFYMNANDWVEIIVWQSSSTNLPTVPRDESSPTTSGWLVRIP